MDRESIEKRKKIIYDFMGDDFYIPMKLKEMAVVLQIPKEERKDLELVLEELVADGKVQISKKGKYQKAKSTLMKGTYIAHQRGFGFVNVEELEEDIFIPAEDSNGAFNHDIVQVSVSHQQRGKRKEGKIVKIIERGNATVVGTFEKSKNFGFVRTDDQRFTKDIFIPGEHSMGAIAGHKVVAEIKNFGDEKHKPEGRIIEILGHINDPGTDILAIVRGYGLPTDFPENVMKQAERTPETVSEEDIQWRKDLRGEDMVTIDGEDAKDLDDAVSLHMEGENYVLGVHIADVTNYVQERSALDKEALERGTSCYLVDRVIPMLPHKLSNGICSLNQGVERLALSCIMTIDPKGQIIGHELAETVIKVNRRMSYTEMKKILEDKDETLMEECKELVPMFFKMEELAALLRERRRKRGSIDFDFPETKMILDEMGRPVDIKPYDRNVATKMIEDFMLAANETVAEDFYWQEIPFVYRTHDNPDPEKILKLSTFINNFGYTMKSSKEEIHPKEFQKLLEKIDGTEEEPLISRLTLRSMKQAKYTTISSGHFGLATQYYCHFTSPIRRYPDLQIHRIIKETLRGKMNGKRRAHYEELLPKVAQQSSERERRAEEAERETIKLKKAQYMKERIGNVYEGVISSVTSWGMYVELPNTIEGMVHVTALKDDYYHFDEDHYEMVGEVTNKRYKLGQKVKVKVTGCDLAVRTIDFQLAGQEDE